MALGHRRSALWLAALVVVLAVWVRWRGPSGSAAVEAPPAAPAPAASRSGPAAASDPRRPAGAPARGRWSRLRDTPAVSEDAAAVRALPYLAGYRQAPAASGVVKHDSSRAYQGLNLYVSGHAAEAVLMDMTGVVRHRWRQPLARIWSDLDDAASRRLDFWRRARLGPRGELLAIFDGLGLIALDAESNLQWSLRGGMHHDLDLAPDGTIWVLDRSAREVPELRPGAMLEDFVTVVSADGELRRRISILEALRRSRFAPLLLDRPDDPDFLHTNTLELLDGRFAARNPAFRAGNVLLSIFGLDAVAILDPEREEIVWALKGMWHRQHQPTFLGDGHLLLLDNLGAGEASRVLEFDPLTLRVAWSYGGDREANFFTRSLGSCQRLPNGNTLITESQNGRAFEVDRAGETVWEFLSPERAGERDELVASLFEVVRLPADFPFRGGDPPRKAGRGESLGVISEPVAPLE